MGVNELSRALDRARKKVAEHADEHGRVNLTPELETSLLTEEGSVIQENSQSKGRQESHYLGHNIDISCGPKDMTVNYLEDPSA